MPYPMCINKWSEESQYKLSRIRIVQMPWSSLGRCVQSLASNLVVFWFFFSPELLSSVGLFVFLFLFQPFIHKASSKGLNNFNAAVPLGITVGSLTVIVVIIVGVIVMRRRSRQRRPSRPLASSLDQDPAASPEERHVVNMQMNGYENPTYKYFESNVPA